MKAVIDTNVFVRGRNLPNYEKYFTVPEVKEEIISRKGETKFMVSDVEVRSPSADVIEAVDEKAEEIGSDASEVDRLLAALAQDLNGVLVTDDKDLQNLCEHLGIDYSGYMEDSIDKVRKWIKVCENCGKEVEGEKCGRCGSSDLTRKPSQRS